MQLAVCSIRTRADFCRNENGNIHRSFAVHSVVAEGADDATVPAMAGVAVGAGAVAAVGSGTVTGTAGLAVVIPTSESANRFVSLGGSLDGIDTSVEFAKPSALSFE